MDEKKNEEDTSWNLRLLTSKEVFIDVVTQKVYLGTVSKEKSCFWKILLSLLLGGLAGFLIGFGSSCM